MMKKGLFIMILLLLGLFLTGCAGYESNQTKATPQPSPAGVYQKITAAKAHDIMNQSNDYVLLDVRTKEEYEQQRIEGAVLLPVTDIKSKAEEQLKDKDAVILVYCRSGNRSAQAAKQLQDMGYTKVYDFGGIINWPYDTVSGGVKED